MIDAKVSVESTLPIKLPSNAPNFKAMAAGAVDVFKKQKLDYTPESLSRLDTQIDKSWAKTRFKGIKFGDKTGSFDASALNGLVTEIGSYFGEVIIKNLGGGWTPSQRLGGWVVGCGPLVINVFHIVDDCFRESSKLFATYKIAKAKKKQ